MRGRERGGAAAAIPAAPRIQKRWCLEMSHIPATRRRGSVGIRAFVPPVQQAHVLSSRPPARPPAARLHPPKLPWLSPLTPLPSRTASSAAASKNIGTEHTANSLRQSVKASHATHNKSVRAPRPISYAKSIRASRAMCETCNKGPAHDVVWLRHPAHEVQYVCKSLRATCVVQRV